MNILRKQLLSLAVQNSAVSRIMYRLECVDSRETFQFRVLTYHRVSDLAAFEQQVHHLACHYHVISMAELLAAYRWRKSLPPRSVLITFDDAYREFAESVWPILKQYGLPVTLFVPTAFPDNPEQFFWWDRLFYALTHTRRRDAIQIPAGRLSLQTPQHRVRAYKRLRNYIKSLPHTEAMAWSFQLCAELVASFPECDVLSWDELRELAHEGVTLGAHTRTHPILSRISPEEVWAEVVGSQRDLEREIGHVLPIFAYPSGGFNNAVVTELLRAGFVMAFTTMRGTNDLRRCDALRLRRNNIGPKATLPVLQARLLQASSWLDRLRPVAKSGARAL